MILCYAFYVYTIVCFFMGSLYRFLWVKFVQILTKSNENGLGLILLFTNVRLKDAFKDKIMRPQICLTTVQ